MHASRCGSLMFRYNRDPCYYTVKDDRSPRTNSLTFPPDSANLPSKISSVTVTQAAVRRLQQAGPDTDTHSTHLQRQTSYVDRDPESLEPLANPIDPRH